jgi:acyl-CoA dehydrogenase
VEPQAEEWQAVRQAVRSLVQGFGPDYFRKLDSERAFPEELYARAAQAGWFGTLVPEAFGGNGAGPVAAGLIIEEINRSGGDAAAINAQMTICGALVRGGSPSQKERFLPGIARGEIRCLSVAATEPESGADMTHLDSRARRVDGGWVIDAQKVFISMAEHTRLLILLVRTEQGPTLFLLDREVHGPAIETRPIDMLVHRMTTMLFIEGLQVADDALIGTPGRGIEYLMGGFALRRVLAACECVGSSRFLLDKSLAHAKERQSFGRFIGQNQGVQYPLAQAYGHVEAADLMRWDALRLIVAGQDAGGRSALAKILASDALAEACRAAMTTFGGWALADEYHIERKLRESTVFAFNNLLLSHVAQHVLGLPKAF